MLKETSVEENEQLPTENHLSQNFPNPFNPETTIRYSIPRSDYVSLKVYDLLGREVATLVDEYRQAGTYNCKWRMENGKLASGVYFYSLRAGAHSQVKKLITMK